eukprot:24717-Rhodomonas_salina.1
MRFSTVPASPKRTLLPRASTVSVPVRLRRLTLEAEHLVRRPFENHESRPLLHERPVLGLVAA